MSDPIKHPDHYNWHPSGVECIAIAEAFNFNKGNAIKYIWRAGFKATSTEIQDLQKAREYIDLEIARLTKPKAVLDRVPDPRIAKILSQNKHLK